MSNVATMIATHPGSWISKRDYHEYVVVAATSLLTKSQPS
jgi:hypothetical protein